MIRLFERIEDNLAGALNRKRVASAYLFLGPEGVGKFTMANRFAKALLCDTRKFPPCEQCRSCRQVETRTHPDLHFLQVETEEKQVKVEQVRAFQERLSYRSFQGGMKVGIIEETERLTNQAMNALLKTLEEPTPDTVLILTCANRSRLLPTVVSRCQILRFPPVSREKLVAYLSEDKGLARERASLLANLAEGSLNRLSELEHSLEQRKKFLTRWLELRSSNPGEIFAAVQSFFARNQEHSMNFLINWYRDLLRVKLNQPQEFNPDFELELKTEAERYSMRQLLESLELLLELEQEINVFKLQPQTAGERIFLKLR
jgi:DNA polymerase-3 subunit delta'